MSTALPVSFHQWRRFVAMFRRAGWNGPIIRQPPAWAIIPGYFHARPSPSNDNRGPND